MVCHKIFPKGFEQNPSVFSHEVWQDTCHEGMGPVFLSRWREVVLLVNSS